MRRHRSAPVLRAAALALLLTPLPAPAIAQQEEVAADTARQPWSSQSLPLEPVRTLEMTLDEGSWMSLDVSPDGSTVVFDLLGDLYALPITGGRATRLTSGMAFDAQPRFSPDGSRIVFVSDRSGAQNLWILPAGGGEPTQLTRDDDALYTSPEWTPDGDYIVASRATGPMGGAAKLWMYHVRGGSGVQLIREPENLKTLGAAFGPDGRSIWFAQRTGDWQYDAVFPIYQLAVYDRLTGEVTEMSSRYGSAFRPTLSPDGRWLVYGSRHDARTGLRLRDLRTGEERWFAYPVQRDDKESRATLDVLPGMSFTPDSGELVASYGGGIWRIPVDGSAPAEVPFAADVSLGLGPEIRFEYDVDTSPRFAARQIRDAALSPDGRTLVFTALNRLYVMSYPDGAPRRLTRGEVGEYAPAWSPDGRSIAYITWSDEEGGHVRRIDASGRSARRLTAVPALYRQIAWSPDGRRIVAVRAAARDLLERSGGRGADFLAIPAAGGEATLIAPTAGRHTPHFTRDPERIYAHSPGDGLVSFRWDGTDTRTHVKVTGPANPRTRRPVDARLILMAPHGDQALVQVLNDLYLVTVPETGGAAPTISVADPARAAFPARRLTDVGGHFPGWHAGGRVVHWSLGNAHFRYDLDAADAQDTTAGGDPYRPAERRVEVAVARDIPRAVAVLRGARVITMRGDEVLERADVVVDGARIAAVGAVGTLEVPDDARVIDVSGTTIVPGFIDTHFHPQSLAAEIHTSQVWQYLATLAYGVTTTRDPQTVSTDVLTYADRVESGEILGPRIYSTGPGIGASEPVRNPEQARDLLRRYREYYGTHTLKLYMAGNRRQQQLIAAAAREIGLMPTTEVGMDLGLSLTHMIDGYAGIEHNVPVFPLYRDVVELLARSGAVNTPTLLVSYGGPLAMNRFFTQGSLHDDPKVRRFHPHEELDRRTRRRGMGGLGSYGPAGWFMDDEYVHEPMAEFLKRVVDAGGRIGVGGHGEFHGPGYHWEMWLLGTGGLTPHAVLRAATQWGAEAIGLARDLGSIEAGKLADLVVLRANPLDDLANTAEIRFVMKNGRLYDADTLDEVWPRARPLPTLPWTEPHPAPAAGIR